MTKKRKKKGRNSTPKPMQKPANAGKGDNEVTQEGKMDFGGLPDIDLKKNLGCG